MGGWGGCLTPEELSVSCEAEVHNNAYRSAQEEPWLFGLLKAKASSNVMRQGSEDQEKGRKVHGSW